MTDRSHSAISSVTVVVATCGRPARLRVALEHIVRAAERVGGCEVVVVDNHPAYEAEAVVSRMAPGSSTIASRRSVPFNKAKALNVGIAAARAEWLAFTDDDTLPDEKWLIEAAAFIRSGTCRVFGGRVVPGDAEGKLPPWLVAGSSGRLPGGGAVVCYDPAGASGVLSEEARVPYGANLFARRDVFREHGGYDEVLWALCGKAALGVDDGEFGVRLQARGESIGYCREATVVHPIYSDRYSLGSNWRVAWRYGWREPFVFFAPENPICPPFRLKQLVVLHARFVMDLLGCDCAGAVDDLLRVWEILGHIAGRCSPAYRRWSVMRKRGYVCRGVEKCGKAKVLAISAWYPPFHGGGYGLLCHRICEGMQARGHAITVLTVNAGGDAASHAGRHRVAAEVRRDLRYVSSDRVGTRLRAAFFNDRAVERTIHEVNPDIVVIFAVDGIGLHVVRRAILGSAPVAVVMGDSWLAQAWADPSRFDPAVGFLSGRASNRFIGRAKRAVGRLGGLARLETGVFPSVPSVMAISQYLVDALHRAKFPVHSAAVCERIQVPIGEPFLDVDGTPVGSRRKASVSGTFRALAVGRLEPLKGLDDAIDAVTMAVRSGGDITLTIAGMDPWGYSRELKRHMEKSGLGNRVRLIPDIDGPGLLDLYMNHDIFLFPSRTVEGFGMVCAEAMACGLPVLATTPGGQDDLVRDGETGFRFDKGDVPKMAELLLRLAHDRSCVERLSTGALRVIREYWEPRVLGFVDRCMDEVLKTGHAPA